MSSFSTNILANQGAHLDASSRFTNAFGASTDASARVATLPSFEVLKGLWDASGELGVVGGLTYQPHGLTSHRQGARKREKRAPLPFASALGVGCRDRAVDACENDSAGPQSLDGDSSKQQARSGGGRRAENPHRRAQCPPGTLGQGEKQYDKVSRSKAGRGVLFSAAVAAPVTLARVASASMALSSATDRAAASEPLGCLGAHPPCSSSASMSLGSSPESSHRFCSGISAGGNGRDGWSQGGQGGWERRNDEARVGEDLMVPPGGSDGLVEGGGLVSKLMGGGGGLPWGQGKGTSSVYGDLAVAAGVRGGPPPRLSAQAVRDKALVGALAGGIAGAFTSAVLHPIDTIKTRLQMRGASKVYKHATDVMVQSVKQHGGLGDLYRGLQTAVLGAGPSSALYFGAYELTKGALYMHLPPQLAGLVPPVAATIGNMVSSIILVPKELIKQRLQVGSADSATKVLLATVRTQGIGGLYVGYGPTLLRNLPSNVINFSVFEWLKAVALNSTGRTTLPSWENFVLGAVSGATSAALTTPLDVVKTRLMTQVSPELIAAAGGSKANAAAAAMAQGGYRGMVDTLRAIAKEEGLAGLTRGMPPRLLYSALFGAVGFFAFENCKAVIYKRQEQMAAEARQRAKEKEAKSKAAGEALEAKGSAVVTGGAVKVVGGAEAKTKVVSK